MPTAAGVERIRAFQRALAETARPGGSVKRSRPTPELPGRGRVIGTVYARLEGDVGLEWRTRAGCPRTGSPRN
jgi:hypothetical protein